MQVVYGTSNSLIYRNWTLSGVEIGQTGLQAEDISQACEDTNNKTQVVLSFSSDSEDEVVEVTNTQIISSLKKRKKVSPPTESSHKKKKPMTLQDTMDTKLDSFASDFKSVCGEMVEKIGVAANALTVDGNKSECVSEEKMQAVRTKFSTSVFISHLDVGKVVEACFNDPTKMKTLFTLPSYMRKAYVVGFLHPQI